MTFCFTACFINSDNQLQGFSSLSILEDTDAKFNDISTTLVVLDLHFLTARSPALFLFSDLSPCELPPTWCLHCVFLRRLSESMLSKVLHGDRYAIFCGIVSETKRYRYGVGCCTYGS